MPPNAIGAVSTGWCSDYNDPWNYMFLYDGTTIHDGPGNLNYSYFNDPVWNKRMVVGQPEKCWRRARAI